MPPRALPAGLPAGLIGLAVLAATAHAQVPAPAAMTTQSLPTGNEVPTLSALVVQGSSAPALTRQFMVSLGMTSATGAACNGPQCGNVTLYNAMRQMPGSTDAWGQNILVTAEPGSRHYLQALEIDVNNHRGDSPLDTGDWVGGITLTGTNAAPGQLNRQALYISTGTKRALWHVGLYADDGAVQEALVYDRGSRGAYSYWNQSSHSGALVFDQGAAPVSLALSGTYSRAAVSTEHATTPAALVAAEGQTVCFSGEQACVVHRGGKLSYSVGGVTVFSVSDKGDAVFKGSVTGNGAP